MSFLDEYAKFGYKFMEDLRATLLDDAAEVVKDVMEEQTDEQVYIYRASDRVMESRRYDNGGLQDRENMVAHLEMGTTLVVENVAPFQNSSLNSTSAYDLSDVVEKGLSKYRQPAPRPFVKATELECVRSGRVLDAINKGLEQKGYEIEKEA